MPTISLAYSVPYLLCGAGFLLLFAIERFARGRCLIISRLVWLACPLLFLFFFGFRGYVGFDYAEVYYPIFQELDTLNGVFEFNHEKGFLLLTWGIRQFTDQWNVYVFIMTLLDVVLLQWLFAKYSPSLALSYFIMYSIDLIFEIDLMRNMKSILICLVALQFAMKRQVVPYVATVALAAMFHKTGVLFLPLYFLLNREFSVRQYSGFLIVMNVIYLLQIPLGTFMGCILGQFSSSMAELYLEGEYNEVARGLTIGWFPKVLPFIWCLCEWERMRKSSRHFIVFFNLYAVYLFVCLGFTDTGEFMRRMSYLFEPALWLVWPVMFACAPKGIVRTAFIAMIVAYGGMKIIRQTKILPFYYEHILLNESAATYEMKQRELTGYKNSK